MDRHELKKIRTEIKNLNTNKPAEAPAPGNGTGRQIGNIISKTINLVAFGIFACIIIAISYFIFY